MDSHAEQISPMRVIHRSLRGRYRPALAAALATSAAFGLFAWSTVKPVYTSTGLIRVSPTTSHVLSGTELAAPGFDSYVAAQSAMIGAQGVLEPALAGAEFAGLGGTVEQRMTRVSRSLSAASKRGEELVRVSMSDTSPRTAKAAVDAIMRAYVAQSDAESSAVSRETEMALSRREEELRVALTDIESAIAKAASPYGGVEALARQHAQCLQAIEGAPGEMGSREAATIDTVLAKEQAALEVRLAAMDGKFTDLHPQVIQYRARLEAVRQMRAGGEKSLLISSASGSPVTEDRSSLLRRSAELEQHRTSVNSLTEEAQATRLKLAEVSKRLEELHLDSIHGAAKRVAIAEMADLPLIPSSDRRLAAAVFAALGGIGTMLGLFVLGGVLESKFRFPDDLAEAIGSTPLLATLGGFRSAGGVHELRHRLEIDAAEHGAGVYAVTGTPDASTGELAVAIAKSLSMTGQRTLLIDGAGTGMAMFQLGQDAPALRFTGDTSEPTPVALEENLWGLALDVCDASAPRVAPLRLAEALERLRGRYERVIIDAGTLEQGLGPALVAGTADGVLMVVGHEASRSEAAAGLARLEALKARCVGVVFDRSRGDALVAISSSHTAHAARSAQRGSAAA